MNNSILSSLLFGPLKDDSTQTLALYNLYHNNPKLFNDYFNEFINFSNQRERYDLNKNLDLNPINVAQYPINDKPKLSDYTFEFKQGSLFSRKKRRINKRKAKKSKAKRRRTK